MEQCVEPYSRFFGMPLGIHVADYACESTDIFLTTSKELESMATPWWGMDRTMRCTILANRLRSLPELMGPIVSASPLTSFSLR